MHYCGNLGAARQLIETYPLNIDDRPIIEYEAPITHRRGRAGATSWFMGQPLVAFLMELVGASPPESDPHLERLSAVDRRSVRAGLALHVARFLDESGDARAAWAAMEEFQRLYAPEQGGGTSESETEQSRRELEQLIETYEERIRALREHIEELEQTPPDSESETSKK